MKRLCASSKSARRSAHASGFCGTCATAKPDITNNDTTRNNLITNSSMLWEGNTQKSGSDPLALPLLSGLGGARTGRGQYGNKDPMNPWEPALPICVCQAPPRRGAVLCQQSDKSYLVSS